MEQASGTLQLHPIVDPDGPTSVFGLGAEADLIEHHGVQEEGVAVQKVQLGVAMVFTKEVEGDHAWFAPHLESVVELLEGGVQCHDHLVGVVGEVLHHPSLGHRPAHVAPFEGLVDKQVVDELLPNDIESLGLGVELGGPNEFPTIDAKMIVVFRCLAIADVLGVPELRDIRNVVLIRDGDDPRSNLFVDDGWPMDVIGDFKFVRFSLIVCVFFATRVNIVNLFFTTESSESLMP